MAFENMKNLLWNTTCHGHGGDSEHFNSILENNSFTECFQILETPLSHSDVFAQGSVRVRKKKILLLGFLLRHGKCSRFTAKSK